MQIIHSNMRTLHEPRVLAEVSRIDVRKNRMNFGGYTRSRQIHRRLRLAPSGQRACPAVAATRCPMTDARSVARNHLWAG
jgi:hypothetical protein